MSATTSRPSALGQYLRFLFWTVVVTVVIAGLGYFPTRRLAGEDSIGAMLAGCGISLFGVAVGAVPAVLTRGASGVAVVNAVLGAGVLRFFMVLMVSVSVALSGWFDREPLLVWVGLSYLALVAVSVGLTLPGHAGSTTTEK